MASDIISSTPVHVLDRTIFVSRIALVEIVKFHLGSGAIVHVEDSDRPHALRFCYEVRAVEGTMHVVDITGRQLGVFADVAAAVDHAEAVTR